MRRPAVETLQDRAAEVAMAMGDAAHTLLRRLQDMEDDDRLTDITRDFDAHNRRRAPKLLHTVADLMEACRTPMGAVSLKQFPELSQDPDVCHGSICVAETRIMAYLLLSSLAVGMSPAEMRKDYPRAPLAAVQATAALADVLVREALKHLAAEATALSKAG